MVMLTDYTGENPFRDYQGWALAGLIALVISVNIIVFIIKMSYSIKLWLKKKCNKTKKEGKYSKDQENSQSQLGIRLND